MPFDITILDELGDYTGQDGATVQAAIEALGLPVSLAYDYHDDLAADLVIEQAVVEDLETDAGHRVVLTLSLGAGAYLDPRKIVSRYRGARVPRVFTRIRYTP